MFLVIVHEREAGSIWSLRYSEKEGYLYQKKKTKNTKIDNSDLISKHWLLFLK